jgi:hypothetical protein
MIGLNAAMALLALVFAFNVTNATEIESVKTKSLKKASEVIQNIIQSKSQLGNEVEVNFQIKLEAGEVEAAGSKNKHKLMRMLRKFVAIANWMSPNFVKVLLLLILYYFSKFFKLHHEPHIYHI